MYCTIQVSAGWVYSKRKRCMDIKTLKGRQLRYAKAENSQKLMLDSNPNLAMSYYVESPHDDISGSYSRITPRVEKVVSRLTCSI